MNTFGVPKSLALDLAWHFVGPDLAQNSSLRVSADDKELTWHRGAI